MFREAYGVRLGGVAVTSLVVANVGTTCAEFAGLAAGFELFGVSRYASVPVAAVLVSVLVIKGTFHRVERVLMAVSAVFVTYVLAGVLSGPDWAAASRGVVVPTLPASRDAVALTTATIGTTLAPWGLSFIQSYAADKKVSVEDLPAERLDVVVGSCLTGIIGFFVVIACASTLHPNGVSIEDASDAAEALEPLAGDLAGTLFAVGLIGAALLAASILPLSTAYSISEFMGREAALDDRPREAPFFYLSFAAVILVGAGLILIPGAPLVTILVFTQVLNAVLLLPLLGFMFGLSRDRSLMGEYAAGRVASAGYLVAIALIAACVVALVVMSGA